MINKTNNIQQQTTTPIIWLGGGWGQSVAHGGGWRWLGPRERSWRREREEKEKENEKLDD